MNKIFKVIWSKSKQCYIVVSEIAKNKTGKKKIVVASILAALAMASSVQDVSAVTGSGGTNNFSNAGSGVSFKQGEGLAIGTNATVASGNTNTVAIGVASVANGSSSFAASGGSTASGKDGQIAIGWSSTNGKGAVAIGGTSDTASGRDTRATGTSAVALGVGSAANGSNAFVASGGSATGNNAIAISGGTANGNGSIAIGWQTNAKNDATAVGSNAQATDKDSVAVGKNSNAAGESATAVGSSATASGRGGVAVGWNAESAVNAVGVGFNAKAKANNTVAIGVEANNDKVNAISNNYSSVSVGVATRARAVGSMAMGVSADASGNYSIALGSGDVRGDFTANANYPKATGEKAIAIGHNSNSSNTAATAIGAGATASGQDSFAGGSGTAGGNSSIAIGKSSGATNDRALAVGVNAKATGKDTVAVGSGAGGTVGLGFASSIDDNKGVVQTIKNINVATTADGDNAVAVGHYANAMNSGVALGQNTLAATGGVAIGKGVFEDTNNVDAGGTVIGQDSTVTGFYSLAVGRYTFASGSTSMAMGYDASAKGNYAVAMGRKVIADGTSTAIGHHAVATNGGLAIGSQDNDASKDKTTASASGAVAIGKNTQSTLKGAVALGSDSTTATNATKQESVTINGITYNFAGATSDTGMQVSVGAAGKERQIKNVAAGEVSATSTDAINGSQLFAIASQIKPIQYFAVNSSVADNKDNTGATGSDSVAIGPKAKAQAVSSIALGNNATAAGGNSIAIGNTSSATDKQSPISIGYGATANGDFSIAIGGGDNNTNYGATANGVGGTALGGRTKTTGGNFQTAVGFGATTTAENASAFGYNTTTSVEGGVALGFNSSSKTGVNKGYNPNDNRTNKYNDLNGNVLTSTTGAIAVGNGSTVTRQITGVAAGTKDTDAVNVAQLKSVNLAFKGNVGSGDVNLATNDSDKKLTIQGDRTYITTNASGNTLTISANKKDINVTNGTARADAGVADAKNVAEAINNAVSQNKYKWYLTADNDTGGSRATIDKEGTVKFSGDSNITVSRNGNTITTSLNKAITVDSVKANKTITVGTNKITLDGNTGAVTGKAFIGDSFTAGNNVLSNTTLQIGSPTGGNNVSITREGLTAKAGTKTIKFGTNGIDAGNQKINNVESAGGVSTNAANYGDVTNAVYGVTLKIKDGNASSKESTVKLADQTLVVKGGTGVNTTVSGQSIIIGLNNDIQNATSKGIGIKGDSGFATKKYLKDGDVIFNVTGDGNLVKTSSTTTGVQVSVDSTKVKDLAVEAVTVSKANNISDNPITVTSKASTNSKDYAIGIDTTKLAAKTNLAYTANGATAKTVSLAKGLNFVNGTNTVATVDSDGKVSFDLNQATKDSINKSATAVGRTITLNADSGTGSSQSLSNGNVSFAVSGVTGDYISTTMDGSAVKVSTKRATINSDANTGAASVTGADGLATAKNVASAINSAVNGLSQNLNISDGTKDSSVALKNQKLTVTGTGAAKATVSGQTITIDVAKGTLTANANGTATGTAGVADASDVASAINNTNTVLGNKIAKNTQDIATNTSNITANKNQITTNTTNIATNTTNIAHTIALADDNGTSTTAKSLKDGDVSFAVTGDGNLVSTSATTAGVKVAVDAAKVKDLAVAAVTVSKDAQADNPITVTPTAGTNSKDYAIGIDTTKLAAKTDLTYRANSAADANAKKVSLSKGLDFVDGGSTVATVDNDGKVSFDLNTATKTQINTNTTDIAANKGKIATNTTNITANTTALARNISLGADTGTASSQSLSTTDVAFNVKGATGDFVSTNMNGNIVEISTKRATINSNATTGEASVTGNDGLATAQNVADAINKAADAAKAGAAWNITTNSSTTDKTAVKGGDTVDLVNGDNIEITQDGTDKKKITVATKKDITVDSVTANNKVTVGSGANKITLDGTDGSVTGKAFTGTTFTGTSFTGTSFTAGNTVINTNGLTNGTTAITGTGVTTDNVTVGGISIDKTTGINAGNKVISNVASGGTTLTNAANIGDVQNAVANLSQNLNITDGTHDGTIDLKNQKLNVAGANGVTATVNNQTITVGLDANTVNATTKGIGLTADTGSTGNKYLKDGDVSFAVTGDGSLVSTSATAAGVKVAVNSATITAGTDGTITGPTTDGVATAKNVADAINAAKKASKTEITANTGEAANATTGNVTLTSTTAADGHTIYDVKLNDKVTLGSGANAVTIDGTAGKATIGSSVINGVNNTFTTGGVKAVTLDGATGTITGTTANIGGVTVDGTNNHVMGLANKDWTPGVTQAVSGRAATEDQLQKVSDAVGAGWKVNTGKVTGSTGESNGATSTKVASGEEVQFQAGNNLIVDQNGKTVAYSLNKALKDLESATFNGTGMNTTVITGDSITQTAGTQTNTSTAGGNTVADGTKSTETTAAGQVIKDGTKTNTSTVDENTIVDGAKSNKSTVDGNTITDGTNTSRITAGKAQIGTVGIDGVASKITTGGTNAVVVNGADGTVKTGNVTVTGGTTNDITGLSNTTLSATDFATKGRAATEEQLKAATGATTLKFTGDVATNTGSVNLKDDTFGIKGDGKYISTDVKGKNVNLTVSEAEVKKSAVAAVTVSTDTTDANNPLTVTPTTSADGTIKDYKVTIDGTKIANKTNLSYKANDGTAKQVSLADGLNFKNGTLTTASIDDAGVVKYDVNTASITAGTDGTITGPTTDGVATAKNVADAINAAKKASKTEITANTGEAANATTGNVTLTSTTAADGHTIYDVKLNDKVTLGTGANAVTIDGRTGAITGKTATIGGVTVNGTTNTIGGLSNTTWNGTATTGRAATEDQLKAVADAASSQTWNITADKAGTTGAQTGTKKNATVGKDETVELVAGDNLTINQNERKFTYSLNKDLAGLTSVSIGTGTTETIKLDGATGKITAKNASIGGVTIDGDNNHVTGLANTTWNGTATTGRAATEDQLKAVADTAKTTTDAVNLKFSGDTNTSPGVVNLKDDTLGIIGDGKYVSTDANGKNLTVKVSEAEVKKSAVAAVTVSTDTTDANNPLTVTPTTSADGTTKDYKVTIDGTKIANKTNLSYKANDGTPKQVSLADGLNFKNGTLTTASIDDAGVVKYDVNTAAITAGADGTITGPTTDGVATAQNVADAINAAKKASKTEITANTGEAANATTGNVTLTSTTAADGHTIYDVKLNDKVTLSSGANAVTIDGTAGKAMIGSSVINGINNTFTTGGAKAVTLDGATGTITATTANIGGVTVNGTANTIGGLSNTTWNGTATTGRAATEDQLKAVADAAGSQTWEITADKKAGTSGAQTGTKENAKVGKDDKVSLIAGENLTVDQAGKNFTYSLNKDLVKMNSATFLGTGTNTTVITGDSITQTAGTQTNTSTAGGNTVADGTKSTETTAAGQVIKDGAKSNKSTVDSNVVDDGNGNVNTSNATSNTITDGTNRSSITAGKATIGSSVINGVNNTFTTGGANAVKLDGAAGTIKTGTVTVTGGTTNDITGLSNTTVTSADFATKGRAATEEQLKAVGEQTWQITADKDTATSGAQTGTKKDAKVGKDDKVQLIAGENMAVNQNERDFTFTLNKDLVKMNSATFLGTGTNTTVITGDSITQTAGTQTNTSTAAGNTVADGTKSTETTADGQVIKDGAKSNKSTVDNNVIDDGNGNVNTSNATSNTITDGTNTTATTSSSVTVKDNAGNSTVITKDNITTGVGGNKITLDGTAGKATVGASVVDGVNNTFTTGGANAVKLDGVAGTIKTGTVTVTGGTTNDITGLSNTTVNSADFATKGRAATEEQLKAVGEQTWQITADKDATTSGAQTGTKKDAKVGKDDKVQLIAGENMTVNQNERDFTFTLNKDLVKMNSATFLGTGTNKTVITGDSITQTAGTQTNTSTAGGNTVADGTKSIETTAAGQVIKDGTKTNTSTVDENTIVDGTKSNKSTVDGNTITDGTNTTETTSSSVTVKDNAGNSTVITKDNITTGVGANKVTLDGTAGKATIGSSVVDGVNNTFTTGGANAVKLDGAAGTIKTGTVTVTGGTTNDITGLSNTTVTAADFATKGRAATEEQLKAVGEQTWQITADKDATTSGAQTGTKKDAKVGKDDKVQLIAGENMTVNQNERDFTFTLNKDLVKMNSAIFEATGGKTTVIKGDSIVQTDGTKVNTSTAGGNTVVDGTKSTATTVDGTTVTSANGNTKYAADGVRINTTGKTLVSLTDAGLDNGNNVIKNVASGHVNNDATDNTNAANIADVKKATTTVTANAGEAANATTGNVTLTSTTAADGHTIYDVKLNDKVTLGSGANAVTIDGTAGKATFGSSVVDGVNNTFTTGGANAVKLDGVAGTIRTGTVTVTGGTTNDITGLSNTTVTGADFATKGRAATEEQLKVVGEQTWQITADKDATTSGAQTGTKKNAKVGKDDKVQLIAGENMTVNQNERDFTFTLNKDLVKMNSATFLGTSTNTTVITGDSITQTAGTQTNTSTAGGNTVADGTKSTETTAAGQVIKDGAKTNTSTVDENTIVDGAKSNKTTVDSNVIDDGNGNVNTSNATSNTITDGTNTSTITAGKATIGSSVIDGVNNTFTTGGANAVKLDGAVGTIKTGTVTVTGGTTNDITGLSNTTVTAADFATKGRAATEEQLKAVGEQTWQITADKDATTSGVQTGTKKDAKVGKDDKVQLIAGENMTVNQNERDFTFTLNKDLVKMNSATFEATGGKTTVIKGDSIVQTDGTKVNTSTAGGNTVADGTKSTETTADGQVIKDGAKSNKSTVDSNVIDDGTGNVNTSNATSNTVTDGTNTTATTSSSVTVKDNAGNSTVITKDNITTGVGGNKITLDGTAGKATVGASVVDGVNNTFTTGGANAVKLDGVAGTIKTGTVTVTGGTTNDITGLSNTTVNSADFATKGRAATEEQLKAVGEQTWQITADKDATTSGAQTGTKKDAKVGKDDKVQLIAGENMTVNQNERDFTFTLNKDLVKMNSATFLGTGTNKTVITGDSITQTAGTQTNTSTAGGNTVADGTKSTETTAAGQVIKDGAKSNKSTVDNNVIDDGNGNVNTSNATSNTITDGTNTTATTSSSVTVKDNAGNSTVITKDNITTGVGGNKITLDGTAGKATVGASVVDGVNNTFTTGGANAVKLDGVAGTIKTGTVTVTGGTTNDITGLSNTTVNSADFATKGRAATEEQLKAVGEQTWQITADKDATTSGAQTGTKKDAKVGKDDKVQLIAGENMTVNQNERDFTFTLNKDLVKMNSATFLGTGSNTTVITGNSITQTAGTQTNTSTAGGNTVADGTKSTETTAAGQVIKDGAKSNKSTVDSNVIDDGNGNVNTSNATSNTITDGTNTSTITAGKANIGNIAVDGVNNKITMGNGANPVTLDGANGHLDGLTNTTWVPGVTKATTGRAATEDQLQQVSDAVGAGWKVNTGIVAGSSGVSNGAASTKVSSGEEVKLQAGDNLVIDQNGKTVSYSLNKDLTKMNSATFEATGGKTTVIKGDSIVQTDGGKTNTSNAAGNTVVDGNKSTATTAAGTTITDGAKTNTSTADKNVINDGAGNTNTATATSNNLADNAGNSNVSNATSNTLKNAAGDETKADAKGVTVKDAAGNNATFTKDGITITKTGKDTVSLTSNGLDNGKNKIVNVAAGVTNTDAVNVGQLKEYAAKSTTELTANNGETAGSTTGNIVLTKTTAADGHTIYDNKLNDKITLGTDPTKAVTVDGTTGMVTGLTNKTWTPGSIVSGRAATEDQLKEAVADSGWKAAVDKEGSGQSTVVGTSPEKIKAEETVTFKAGNNMMVTQTGKSISYAVNPELTNMTSATFKDAAGNTTVTNGNGITITPGSANPTNPHAGPVSLTKDGLNNGNNQIKGVAPGTDPTDAVNVSQLNTSNANTSQAINQIAGEVQHVGAHAAAMAALKPIQYDPLEPTQVMAGVGNYRGETAAALGLAHYTNENTMFNVGVSVGGNHNMVNAGVTHKFGYSPEKKNIPDRYKAGPISSVYVMQDEVSSLKKENAEQKYVIADQAARLTTLEAENEQQRRELAETKKGLDDLKAAVDKLLASKG